MENECIQALCLDMGKKIAEKHKCSKNKELSFEVVYIAYVAFSTNNVGCCFLKTKPIAHHYRNGHQS